VALATEQAKVTWFTEATVLTYGHNVVNFLPSAATVAVFRFGSLDGFPVLFPGRHLFGRRHPFGIQETNTGGLILRVFLPGRLDVTVAQLTATHVPFGHVGNNVVWATPEQKRICALVRAPCSSGTLDRFSTPGAFTFVSIQQVSQQLGI